MHLSEGKTVDKPEKAVDHPPSDAEIVPATAESSIPTMTTTMVPSQQDRHNSLNKLIAENEPVFQEALNIFKQETDARERSWLSKKYKRNQVKPPESLSAFIEFLYDADKRLSNSPFRKLYMKVRGSESSIRHLGIVVDSIVTLVPDPASTPTGLVCK